MPKAATTHLLLLIQSLTTAEKRNFRRYVSRNGASSDLLFVRLFDLLDKVKIYDEKFILKKIPSIKPTQLSNLKANLYKQLLASLRHIQRSHQLPIQIQENLDYAQILYSKGLYRSSLSMIDKTKKLALKRGYFTNALQALEFEKYIESQYVTGSMYPKAKLITDETEMLIEKLELTHKLSNLSLSMYALYLQYGHVKKGENFDKVTKFLKSELKGIQPNKLDFYQQLYYNQSFVWYYFMIQDFPNNYRYAQKWVDLFETYPEKKGLDTPLYIKGLHNVLSALFMNQRPDRFMPHYQALMNFNQDHRKQLTANEKGQLLLYQTIHTIHKTFMTGEYDIGVKQMPSMVETLRENKYSWDAHRVMVIKYKIACVYFGAGQLEESISILNEIILHSPPDIREDIQCYARILNLVAHFDLGNDLLVSYQIKSVYRFLLKYEQEEKVLQLIFKFIRKTPRILESQLKEEFLKLRDELKQLEDDPYERRPFIYFDIISWLESKINTTRVQEEIQKKIKTQRP